MQNKPVSYVCAVHKPKGVKILFDSVKVRTLTRFTIFETKCYVK